MPSTSPVWDAVRDTTGQILLWEGEIFPAFYHTESGGYTEDPRTVFAARNMPALKPVVCPFSAGSAHYFWNLDLRLADISEALRRGGVDVGQVRRIMITERTPSLRAATISVTGTRGQAQVRGNDFRRLLGYDTFKSTLFAVAIDGDVARFAGRGYGHGVGMCQCGREGHGRAAATRRARSSSSTTPARRSASSAEGATVALTWAEFEKVDMRVGIVVDAQPFPEARRPALKLQIDFGPLGVKRSSAQITAHYRPDDLVGRRVIAVVNFPPKQIGPFVSEVLVLGAYDERGEVVLLRPDLEVSPGAKIG